MKNAEIRELSPQELDKKMRDTETELVNLRVRKQVGQVEDPSQLRQLRKEIARMKTILHEKRSAEASA